MVIFCILFCVSLQIQQKKSLFAFGTAVAASLIVDPSKKAYQDYFYNTFEWAVMENAMKWHEMERNEVRQKMV